MNLGITFEDWRNDCEQNSPQFKFWSISTTAGVFDIIFCTINQNGKFCTVQTVNSTPFTLVLDHTIVGRKKLVRKHGPFC